MLFRSQHFLKLDGPVLVKSGVPATFTVTDGATGNPIVGATVGGPGVSGIGGEVQVVFHSLGKRSLKAERNDSIRSNRVEFLVVA